MCLKKKKEFQKNLETLEKAEKVGQVNCLNAELKKQN